MNDARDEDSHRKARIDPTTWARHSFKMPIWPGQRGPEAPHPSRARARCRSSPKLFGSPPPNSTQLGNAMRDRSPAFRSASAHVVGARQGEAARRREIVPDPVTSLPRYGARDEFVPAIEGSARPPVRSCWDSQRLRLGCPRKTRPLTGTRAASGQLAGNRTGSRASLTASSHRSTPPAATGSPRARSKSASTTDDVLPTGSKTTVSIP